MRLDKYLSHFAALTRSEARAAVKSSEITVNGDVVKNFGLQLKPDDEVAVLGQIVEQYGDLYLMLYKPMEVICATEDEDHDTVLDLIPDYDHRDLHIAGRLDKDTTGLVLLTTDGKWSHRVTSPKHACEKVYRVETADPIDESLPGKFQNGILLKDSDEPTLPSLLEIQSEYEATVTLTEGRYHQVKRMFGACGNKVEMLHRSAVGSLTLEGLEEGQCRELTEEEVQSFLK